MVLTKLKTAAALLAALLLLGGAALPCVVLAAGRPDGKADDAAKPAAKAEDKPKLKPLTLVVEAASWEGKPYLKVFLRNPNKVSLGLEDSSSPAFKIEKFCTVLVDGKLADVHSRGVFSLPNPSEKMELPDESKTSLGILAFDYKVAQQFDKGYTPVVGLVAVDDKGTRSWAPLPPGKYKLEIQPTKSTQVRFPAEVLPATIEVELPK